MLELRTMMLIVAKIFTSVMSCIVASIMHVAIEREILSVKNINMMIINFKLINKQKEPHNLKSTVGFFPTSWSHMTTPLSVKVIKIKVKYYWMES